MQPTTLKLYVHHAVRKCENGTDVIQMLLLKVLSMPTKQSTQLRPWIFVRRLDFGLKIFKKLTPDIHLSQNQTKYIVAA